MSEKNTKHLQIIKEKKEILADTQKELGEKKKNLEDMTAEKEKFKEESIKLAGDLKKTQDELKKTEDNLAAKEKEVTRLTEDVKAKETKIAELDSQLKTVGDANKILAEEKGKLEKGLEETNKNLNIAKQDRDKLDNDLAVARKEAAKIKKAWEDYTKMTEEKILSLVKITEKPIPGGGVEVVQEMRPYIEAKILNMANLPYITLEITKGLIDSKKTKSCILEGSSPEIRATIEVIHQIGAIIELDKKQEPVNLLPGDGLKFIPKQDVTKIQLKGIIEEILPNNYLILNFKGDSLPVIESSVPISRLDNNPSGPLKIDKISQMTLVVQTKEKMTMPKGAQVTLMQ